MISATQRAQLIGPPLLGAFAHCFGAGIGQAATRLDHVEVVFVPHAVLAYDALRAQLEHAIELGLLKRHAPVATVAGGNRTEEVGHDQADDARDPEHRPYPFQLERCRRRMTKPMTWATALKCSVGMVSSMSTLA